jgi:tetratricopeptide (TPR) repeat protein
MPPCDPRRARAVLIAALVAGAAAFVYRDVGGFAFVNLDDPDYVSRNPAVLGGLSWRGLAWALTSFHAANWHPLTWLSHMADASLFGADAGAHHLVSLGLHAAVAVALFWLLCSLTGARWRSAAAAALFAVHPVQVEAVAWVAERKTLLAALLGLLAVRAYVAHVARPGWRSSARVALLLALGLLAKPMLVVLPPLLLLLDWWPLGRGGGPGGAAARARALLAEKAPLFALALLSGVITIAAQSRVGAVASLETFPLPLRLANALASCAAYLGALALPTGLSVFYPHPAAALPWGRVAGAAALLCAVSLATLRLRRVAPALLFGWLWYLIALLPVLGLLQVGGQARADRYLYLPLIGVCVALVWGAASLARSRPRALAALALAAALALLASAAHRQAGYWRTSRTLWEHALAVDPTSERALYQLSEYEKELGRLPEQIALLRRLVALSPRHERARNNLIVARRQAGEPPQALLEACRELLAINPRNVKALQNYGYLLLEAGRPGEAVEQLQRAVDAEPGYCAAINNLGRAHLALGDKPKAQALFARAAACDPDETKYKQNLELAR